MQRINHEKALLGPFEELRGIWSYCCLQIFEWTSTLAYLADMEDLDLPEGALERIPSGAEQTVPP
jgi:hypothetical protein